MRLTPDSGSLVIRGPIAWRRCAFDDTVLIDDLVTLKPAPTPADEAEGAFTGGFAGLAFDPHCRLFHPRPEDGAIDFVPWGTTSTLGVHATQAAAFPITAAGTEVDGAPTGALPASPRALAADTDAWLYLADDVAEAVWIIDSWQQEIARRIAFDAAPVDIAACGDAVFVLLAGGETWQLAPCEAPVRTDWPAIADAERLTVSASASGGLLAWVLTQPGSGDAELHALHDDQREPAPFATDLVSEDADPDFGALLTLAGRPGEPFRRWRIHAGVITEQPGLVAPHYDGRGIALAPDGRIAYWTTQGLRHAAPARTRYQEHGWVFGFALDSGIDQTRWGRLQVEACIPSGTEVRFRAFSRDELDYHDPMAPTLPGAAHPEAPLLSINTWSQAAGEPQRLYRDDSQRPLTPTPAAGFAWYDAPVMAPSGRYLWLVFELTGTRGKTPRLRGSRVDYPGHDLLSKLPLTLWRDAAAQAFLFRYLMPIAAILDEWEGVSADRHRLLDPRIAPSAALSWLAGFVALVLDPCWPEAAQRRMISEAAALFRTRGTLASLRRMLEILTSAEVIIIEHFRLRGGGVVGNPEVNASQAVLGVGYRVGGRIGALDSAPLPDTEAPDFDDFAHRFTVTVVAALSDAQLECVRRLIEQHKPAHTTFALCTSATSMRAGLGAHVGISSVLSRSVDFNQAVVGDAALGTGVLLGRPALREDQE